MVHGFDNNGKAYDKDGFKLNWWTKEEEKDYANRTKCLVIFDLCFLSLTKTMEY